jgi:hypothetical protein
MIAFLEPEGDGGIGRGAALSPDKHKDGRECRHGERRDDDPLLASGRREPVRIELQWMPIYIRGIR